MSRAARSLFVFGLYLCVSGLALLLAPDPLLRLFGLVDLLAAAWTWLALRADGARSRI